MAAEPPLDAAGSPRKGRVIRFLAVLVLFYSPVFAGAQISDEGRLAAARKAFDAGQWEEALRLARGPADQSPDLDFLAGLVLAHEEKWSEAKLALEAGLRKAPRDSRFLDELAGVAYKQKDFPAAKGRLHSALRLNPQDAYAGEFLATLYFLEGNLEAALPYWNPRDKPRLLSVEFVPSLKLKEPFRNRALAFNAPQVLSLDALLTTESRLENLGIFQSRRMELTPTATGNYDLTLHLKERNGWGDSKLDGIVSLLGGLPYATVYPEFYNLGHGAVNVESLVRWDSEKRRVSLALSLPVYGDPGLRLRVYADARNENWNLTGTFSATGAPPGDLNIRRLAAGAEFRSVVNGNWNWTSGAEIAHRNFRNLAGPLSIREQPFFTASTSLLAWLGGGRSLVRIPERRFTLDTSAELEAGREFATVLGPSGTLRGALRLNWFPLAKGDDYQIEGRIRAGATAGKVSIDRLFQLGVERDNDLWLRGHRGTTGGRKGAAPLGRRYFLANWEMDKNIYRNGFFTLKLGPFLDSGAIRDSSGLFGQKRWLWDSGVQGKVQVFGGTTVLVSYGRDLRGGKGVFYATILREIQAPFGSGRR